MSIQCISYISSIPNLGCECTGRLLDENDLGLAISLSPHLD
jgi:hypothetical protein